MAAFWSADELACLMDKKILRTLKVPRKMSGKASQIKSTSVQTSIICLVICNEEFSQLLSILKFQKSLLLARLVGWVPLLSVSAWLCGCPHALAGVQCDLR